MAANEPSEELDGEGGVLDVEEVESVSREDVDRQPNQGVQSGETAGQWLADAVKTLGMALILFFLIRTVVQNYRVQNISMEPNLHEGQLLIVDRFAYCPGLNFDFPPLNIRFSRTHCVKEPERGDIIVFHYPQDPTQDYIKRVIGLPGESVEVRQGKVYINGVFMPEPFGPNPGSYTAPRVTLSGDQIYVMGDNRNNSSDSHVWGPLSMRFVVGRALARYWPPSKWTWIPHYEFPSLQSAGGTVAGDAARRATP
jgi:signal peptidase I